MKALLKLLLISTMFGFSNFAYSSEVLTIVIDGKPYQCSEGEQYPWGVYCSCQRHPLVAVVNLELFRIDPYTGEDKYIKNLKSFDGDKDIGMQKCEKLRKSLTICPPSHRP